MSDLFARYDIPAPRYTSYPTVPYWSDCPSTEDWMNSLSKHFPKANGWSMYIHIPFCESLCTFCGCNTSITKNHKHESSYVDLLIEEFDIYRKSFPNEMQTVPLKHIHLGGGTPTFLSADNLKRLVSAILSVVKVDSHQFEGSLEVDPRKTTVEQLEVLSDLGFNRISLGVQDFDERVQEIVNRVQPFSMTKRLTEQARALGYDSINYDLIYGLPMQTRETIKVLAEKTVELRPDRIALYSFAMVPWIKPAQRKFKDEDVPTGMVKRELYEIARGILLSAGYREIGMDHFALETDALSVASENKTLHRNFMGYSDQKTEIMLGLGVSSISESPDCFHQNEKRLPVYSRRITEFEIPTFRGHKLSQQDIIQREKILQFMTMQSVRLGTSVEIDDIQEYLQQMIQDDLIKIESGVLSLTDAGRPFLRNACMALDLRLRETSPDRQVFSRSL